MKEKGMEVVSEKEMVVVNEKVSESAPCPHIHVGNGQSGP